MHDAARVARTLADSAYHAVFERTRFTVAVHWLYVTPPTQDPLRLATPSVSAAPRLHGGRAHGHAALCRALGRIAAGATGVCSFRARGALRRVGRARSPSVGRRPREFLALSPSETPRAAAARREWPRLPRRAARRDARLRDCAVCDAVRACTRDHGELLQEIPVIGATT